MTEITFQKFVEATYVVAADLEGEKYIPTYIDPLVNEFLVLEGIPDDVCMQTAAREWAQAIGARNYFLSYQDDQEIVLENYSNGRIFDTVHIEVTNSRIQ